MLRKTFTQAENDFKDHIGFSLYDISKRKTVIDFQSDRYFTPASNTKIFTFYASLNILGDSIPGLFYVESPDSLIIWGTGDPSFLYRNTFDNGRTYDFLKQSKNPVYFSSSNFYENHFGAGWMWDDYNSSDSPERSPLPIYANQAVVKSSGTEIRVMPSYFQPFVSAGIPAKKNEAVRDVESNVIVFHPGVPRAKNYEAAIPFKTTPQLTAILLSDTLDRNVLWTYRTLPVKRKTLYSVPADSLYKVMMQASDNFIAEQLLLICASKVSDSLNTDLAIKYVKKNFLNDLADEPIWVDGSGLSRYNLFTPRSIVQLWDKIYASVPRERLFSLLAAGGQSGTIRNWYKSDTPYIYGKTGTLRNNHCLSGYLVTKKGEVLIFSFMNSNFARPGNEVRRMMQETLKLIYEKY